MLCQRDCEHTTQSRTFALLNSTLAYVNPSSSRNRSCEVHSNCKKMTNGIEDMVKRKYKTLVCTMPADTYQTTSTKITQAPT